MSYSNQAREFIRLKPTNILEIGIGNGIVRDALRNLGFAVTTVDIDSELSPDHVASVSALPFPNDSFDAVLAAEILEHIPFEDFSKALAEIHRVARRYVYITLPHAGAVFSLNVKMPLLPRLILFFKIPFFWKQHIFNGEHYWELGKRNFPVSRIKTAIKKAVFNIREAGIDPADPAHYFFSLIKYGKSSSIR